MINTMLYPIDDRDDLMDKLYGKDLNLIDMLTKVIILIKCKWIKKRDAID